MKKIFAIFSINIWDKLRSTSKFEEEKRLFPNSFSFPVSILSKFLSNLRLVSNLIFADRLLLKWYNLRGHNFHPLSISHIHSQNDRHDPETRILSPKFNLATNASFEPSPTPCDNQFSRSLAKKKKSVKSKRSRDGWMGMWGKRVGYRRKREVAMLQMPRGIKQTTVSEHAHSESDTPFAFGRVAEIRFDDEREIRILEK